MKEPSLTEFRLLCSIWQVKLFLERLSFLSRFQPVVRFLLVLNFVSRGYCRSRSDEPAMQFLFSSLQVGWGGGEDIAAPHCNTAATTTTFQAAAVLQDILLWKWKKMTYWAILGTKLKLQHCKENLCVSNKRYTYYFMTVCREGTFPGKEHWPESCLVRACLRTCIFAVFSETEQNPTWDKSHGGQGLTTSKCFEVPQVLLWVLSSLGCLQLGSAGCGLALSLPSALATAVTSWAGGTRHALALPAAVLSSSCFLQESGIFLAVNTLLAWFMHGFFELIFWFPFTVNLLFENWLLQDCLHSGWRIATNCVVRFSMNYVLLLWKKAVVLHEWFIIHLGWPERDWSWARWMMVSADTESEDGVAGKGGSWLSFLSRKRDNIHLARLRCWAALWSRNSPLTPSVFSVVSWKLHFKSWFNFCLKGGDPSFTLLAIWSDRNCIRSWMGFFVDKFLFCVALAIHQSCSW